MERTEIGLLLVKAESSYGVDPTPTQAANIIPTVRDQITYDLTSDFETRKVLDGTLAESAGYVTKPHVVLKFRYEVRGNRKNGGTELDISNGTLTQAIEIDALLQAADMVPTYTAAGTPGAEGVSAGTRDGNVKYKPIYTPTYAQAEGNSVTCWWYTTKKLHKLVGGKVDFSIIIEAGKIAYIDFTVTGKYVAITDNNFALSSNAHLSTKPPVWNSVTATLGGIAMTLSQAQINLGNQIIMRPSVSASDNIAGFVRASFSPNGRVNPESISEASDPRWADFIANTVRTLVLQTTGDSGNRLRVEATTQSKKVNLERGGGIWLQPIDFAIVKSVPAASAPDIVSLTFS